MVRNCFKDKNSSQIFEKIDENIFVAGCYNGSGIGVGTLFGEQIAIKASNEHTLEIETIEKEINPHGYHLKDFKPRCKSKIDL